MKNAEANFPNVCLQLSQMEKLFPVAQFLWLNSNFWLLFARFLPFLVSLLR